VTPETGRERQLREQLDEAHFQIKLLTWIGAFLFFALLAVLAWR
jgi:hypothetical protein